MDLKQSKRKNIRQERKKVQAQNLHLKRLRGDDIKVWRMGFVQGCREGAVFQSTSRLFLRVKMLLTPLLLIPLQPWHWDAFYKFYRNTTDNK
jgi:predicted N-acyltransferase